MIQRWAQRTAWEMEAEGPVLRRTTRGEDEVDEAEHGNIATKIIGVKPRVQNLTIPCQRVLWCRSAEPTISSSLKAVRLNRAGLLVESSQIRPLCHASCVNGLWFATPGCQEMGRKPGAKVKLLVIGGLIGLVIGVVLTVFYFSLATFFAVQAKALEAAQTGAENGNAIIDRRRAGDRRKSEHKRKAWIS